MPLRPDGPLAPRPSHAIGVKFGFVDDGHTLIVVGPNGLPMRIPIEETSPAQRVEAAFQAPLDGVTAQLDALVDAATASLDDLLDSLGPE